jgi:hypothetical protein
MEIKYITPELKITKLDGRHNGWQRWKYFISAPSTLKTGPSVELFVSWRVWCWETWGPSKELDYFYFSEVSYQNDIWCWENDDYKRRIYLQNDEHLSLFMLRWA